MLSIEAYNLKYKSQWDFFVDESKNGTFLFKRDFMEYHSSRFNDFSLLIFKNSKLIGIFPANRESNILYSHNGLTYGGLIVMEGIKLNEFLNIFCELLKFCHINKIIKLVIKTIPSIYNISFSGELDYISFLTNAVLYRKDVISVIDLNSKIKISKDRVQGFKRGIKNKLILKEKNNFKEFWDKLLIPNLSRKYSVSPVHSISEIEYLKNKFQDNIRQFNVYKGDEIVAGTTIFQTKNVIHVQYTASNTDKNQLGSLDFLFYKLINEIFSDYNFFDFGTSNERRGRKINLGLLYWKEGFGARSLTQSFYEIETANFDKIDVSNLMI